MKKLIYIFVGVALAVSVLAGVGYAYAQTDDPDDSEDSPFPLMGRFSRRGPGMWGGHGGFGPGGDGVLSEYMIPAMGEAFGLTSDQVKVLQDAKALMKDVFTDLSPEELQAGMRDAFSTAIENAVADDAITQEEADQMLERMDQFGTGRFGGHGGFGGRGMMGGRGGLMGFGLMQDYFHPALAEAVGLTTDELTEAMYNGGYNLKEFAEEQGLTNEELADLMAEVYTNAINAALADEAITQDQADQMLEALENFDGRIPFGPGRNAPYGFWSDQP